jgi:hypothetical protein
MVRDQNGVDIGGRVSEPRQRRAEITPVSRKPGVEESEPAAVLEQVPVGVDAPEPMDALADLGKP